MANTEYISSRQNKKIIEAVSLRDAKNVRETGLFFFEGKKLFAEAINRGVEFHSVFLREDCPAAELTARLDPSVPVYTVSNAVYEKISAEKSPEGVFCIAKTLDKYHKFATIYYKQENFADGARTLLAAVSVRDPGNLGSIIRSSAAFDCGGLILSDDCANLYSNKTVRASMGTVFDFPILVTSDMAGSIRAMQAEGIRVYGAALQRNALPLTSLPRAERCCVLVGNEGHGLPEELLSLCDGTLFIPMSEKAESLNAAVASAIVLWHRYTG